MRSGSVVEDRLDPALLPDPLLPPDPFGDWLPVVHPDLRPWWADEVDAAGAPDDSAWRTASDCPSRTDGVTLCDALAPGTFAPGAATARLLESTDLSACDADSLVGLLVLAAGQESWAAAVKLAAVSALVDRVAGYRGVSRDGQHTPGRTVEASRMAAAEVGAALALSPGSAAEPPRVWWRR